MFLAQADGNTPTTIIGAFIFAFISLLGVTVWLLRQAYSATLPDLTKAFTASHTATLEHCDRQADKERVASEKRFDMAILEMRRQHDETLSRVDRIHQMDLEELQLLRSLVGGVQQRTRLADIVTSAEDAIWTKTLEGFITSWNRAAERLLGWRAEEVVQQSVYKVIPPDQHEEERNIPNHIARGERVERYEAERFHKDGRRVKLWITISPLKEPTGRVIGVSSIAREA
jgi:PAS domain S-box-containing protein